MLFPDIDIEQISAHKCKVLGGRRKEQPIDKILTYWDQGTETYKSVYDRRWSRFLTGLLPYLRKHLGKQGHEFGTTTGRARRCGWFDAVATRHACRLNGVDELSLMKLDVLDGFDEVKVCVAYEYNGEQIDYMPADLDAVTPVYKTFKGWNDSVGARKFEDLPEQAQEYVKTIEEISQTKVGIISTSPERDDTIIL